MIIMPDGESKRLMVDHQNFEMKKIKKQKGPSGDFSFYLMGDRPSDGHLHRSVDHSNRRGMFGRTRLVFDDNFLAE